MSKPTTPVDMLGAMLATQCGILAAMVEAKVVDARQMRDFLQNMITELKPDEQSVLLATCLRQVVTMLEKRYLSQAPGPRPH